MKKFMIVCFLAALSTGAYAQEGENKNTYPYWTISKDVQRIQLVKEDAKAAEVVTGNADWTRSKGPASLLKDVQPKGKVVLGKTPSHVISKGVARMNAERSR